MPADMPADTTALLSRRAPSRTALPPGGSRPARGHGIVVALALLVVPVLDQLSKAWAWRSLDDVHINSGGNPFSGVTVGDLLAGRTSGAVLDVVNTGVLVLVAWLLARFSPTRAVALTGAAALAGWASNLGDRLGLHHLTAPGSVRGVVDFIPFDGHYWNTADVVIALGTAGFVVAVLAAAAVSALSSARRDRRPAVRRPVSAWLPVVVATVLLAACVLAVTNTGSDGFLDGPSSVAASAWDR